VFCSGLGSGGYARRLSVAVPPRLEVIRTRWSDAGSGSLDLIAEGRVYGSDELVVGDLALRVTTAAGSAWVRPSEVSPAQAVRAFPSGNRFTATFALPESFADGDYTFDVVARRTEHVAFAPPPAPVNGLGRARFELDRGPVVDVRLPPRRRGRVARLLPVAGLLVGALLVGDGVATLVWKEPLSSLYASHRQYGLADRLRDLDRMFAAPAAAAVADDEAGQPLPAAPTTAAASAPTTAASAATTAASPSGSAPTRAARPAPVLAPAFAAPAARLRAMSGQGDPLGVIEIPSIGARFVFVEGTSASSLRAGPAHYRGTVLPGQPGTVGIAGHRTTYLAPFRKVGDLRPGNPIVVRMPYGRFTYRVQGTLIVSPHQAEILRSAPGTDRLILTACHPLSSSKQRIVVYAKLVDSRRT